MYERDQEHEFPVYLLDINGFGVNVFVQIETTAPLPTRRRSKKRSQKKASERRLSKQNMVSDGYVLHLNDYKNAYISRGNRRRFTNSQR